MADIETHLPFEVRRLFWIFDVPGGSGRGEHAHREQRLLLVAVSGSFSVDCDDGATSGTDRLCSPEDALLVPEMVWHRMSDFSVGAVCLVLASGPHKPGEKILDYGEFLELTATP